jgi:hypothetical protein
LGSKRQPKLYNSATTEKKKMTPGQIVISVAVGLVTFAIAYRLAFHAAHWLRNH